MLEAYYSMYIRNNVRTEFLWNRPQGDEGPAWRALNEDGRYQWKDVSQPLSIIIIIIIIIIGIILIIILLIICKYDCGHSHLSWIMDIYKNVWSSTITSLTSSISSRYEFEANKRNNLIFYGLAGADKETPQQLRTKVCIADSAMEKLRL